MTSSKLILSKQFRGVDKNKEIININKQLPEAKWFHGDFIDQIKSNPFNPGIIDCDIMKIKDAPFYLANILRHISASGIREVMVVINTMLSNPYTGKSINGDSIIERLSNIDSFKFAQSISKWDIHPVRFIYNGEDYGTKTDVGSFIFISA